MLPISPNTLAYEGTALDALEELAKAKTYVELLHVTHSLWCGSSCSRDIECKFLHYKMTKPKAPKEPDPFLNHRYNKCTAKYFTLMGGEGYEPGFPQEHRVNFWLALESALRRIDGTREQGDKFLFCDYTDWTKKQNVSARQVAQCLCRDIIQWMAIWTGIDLKTSPLEMWLTAMITSPDDFCIPPLDVVHGKFRLYGRSLRDLVQAMVGANWGRDATHVLLGFVRQLLFQYVEKAEFEGTVNGAAGIHAQTGRDADSVWDSVVLRTHTAGTYACMIIVSRMAGLGPLDERWVLGSSANSCVAMDLAKSAARIYHVDNHQPTLSFGGQGKDKSTQQQQEQEQPTPGERRRKVGYHSVYLDMMDDLVDAGCPELLLHVAGTFLGVQLVHRYWERSLGYRIPIHRAMANAIRSIYGDDPTDARLDGLFRLRQLVSNREGGQKAGAEPTLCPDLLAACLERQRQRESAWKANRADTCTDCTAPVRDSNDFLPDAAEWISDVHRLSQQADNPQELQKLLTSLEVTNSTPLSIGQLNAVGSQDDIWALCMACKVDCCENCEWLAFAKYIWKQFCCSSSSFA
ncbi:uncharacterized protein F4812DRAFT_203198 [Daldinia caldariorum]|uniref:uncharacterized protein n=1 Tax=Daldinia caldariorum TaxID=326644 RepID=UPI00200766D9|nr:uncharacterized protein F4812DRAFT_203198 [Daldinia caldariorum]KAI1472046.1 hypothetical protein F4812DRAFT_203198 [Daldinia caldariorum]